VDKVYKGRNLYCKYESKMAEKVANMSFPFLVEKTQGKLGRVADIPCTKFFLNFLIIKEIFSYQRNIIYKTYLYILYVYILYFSAQDNNRNKLFKIKI